MKGNQALSLKLKFHPDRHSNACCKLWGSIPFSSRPIAFHGASRFVFCSCGISSFADLPLRSPVRACSSSQEDESTAVFQNLRERFQTNIFEAIHEFLALVLALRQQLTKLVKRVFFKNVHEALV